MLWCLSCLLSVKHEIVCLLLAYLVIFEQWKKRLVFILKPNLKIKMLKKNGHSVDTSDDVFHPHCELVRLVGSSWLVFTRCEVWISADTLTSVIKEVFYGFIQTFSQVQRLYIKVDYDCILSHCVQFTVH